MPQLELESGIYFSKYQFIIPEKDQIKLNNYNPYAAIKAELSVGK
jgi:thymidylate synthase